MLLFHTQQLTDLELLHQLHNRAVDYSFSLHEAGQHNMAGNKPRKGSH
jgi:hypothetical protein